MILLKLLLTDLVLLVVCMCFWKALLKHGHNGEPIEQVTGDVFVVLLFAGIALGIASIWILL